MEDIIQRFIDRQPSRNELLKTGGEFTVQELREFGLGPEERDEWENLGRQLFYVNDVVPVRLVPSSLLHLAESIWGETGEIGRVIESLWTSFHVFRECVNKGWEVPLVKKDDGIWEWPEPVGFEWGDEDTKTLAMLFGAYSRKKEVEVSVIKGNTVHRLTLPSGIVSEEEVSDVVARPEEKIKLNIPALKDVRMINQQAWQNHALRTWAGQGHLLTAFSDLINNKLDSSRAEDYIMSMVSVLKDDQANMPVVRYCKENEKRLASNLFILEF